MTLQNHLNGNFTNGGTTLFHNIMYKADGSVWFEIFDNDVYDDTGTLIGSLSVLLPLSHYNEVQSEIGIVPVPHAANLFYLICPGYYFILDMCNIALTGPIPLTSFVNPQPAPVAPLTLHYANGLAIAPYVTSGSGDFHYLFMHDVRDFFIYKITQTGINFISKTALNNISFTNDLISEMECRQLANGNYRVAFPSLEGNPYISQNSPDAGSCRIDFFEIDMNGAIQSNNSIMTVNSIPWHYNDPYNYMVPKGLEFSPDGNTLYYSAHSVTGNYTYNGCHLFYIDISAGINSLTGNELNINIVFPDDDFQKSMMEIGYDQKLYISTTDRMATIANPNSPTNALSNYIDNAVSFATYPKPIYHTGLIPFFDDIFALPDQIDGQNYGALIGNISNLNTSMVSPQPLCPDGTLLLDATVGFTNYIWSTGATTQTITVTNTGTYTVTVTYGCNLTASASVIVIPSNHQCSITYSLNCSLPNMSTLTANATGGIQPYTFYWNTGAASSIISNLATGTYTATVTDTKGCTFSASLSIIIYPPLNLALVSTGNICVGASNGTITSQITGGALPYNFIWNNGSISQSLNNVSAGTYTVTVTDANGCTLSASTTINNYPPFNLTTTTKGDCTGEATGTITANTSQPGPLTYLWSNGQTAQTATGLFAGTYTVTATDANGCTNSASSTIIDLSENVPIISASSFTSCIKDLAQTFKDIDLTIDNYVNDPAYIYTWSFVPTGAPAATLVGNGSTAVLTTYGMGGTVTVHLSVNGCDFYTNFYIQDCCEGVPSQPNSTTLVDIDASDLIAMYGGNPTVTTNDNLYFNGTLTVNVPFFAFSNCQFLNFGPAAKIVCSPNTALQIDGSHLQACNTMWYGIEMGHSSSVVLKNNIIQDAQYAVKATDNCQTTLVNNDMNDNFVSYFVAPDVTSQMINGAIQENRFYTVNQLVQPYLGQTPVIHTHSFAGIWINDVTALTIGSYNAAAPKNIFRNLNNGIISNRTNLTSLYNIFDDISSKGGYSGLTNTTLFNHTGTGITAYGGIGYIADIAGDAGPGNVVEFTNCFRGIYVDGLQAKVYDHEFTTTNTTGINRIGIAVTNMHKVPTHIFRNTIHATQAGIRATENYNAVHIYDNTITIDNPANNPFFRTGISIDNFTNALGANIDVHHNHIYMTDARRGIWLRNTTGAWVHENDVWMQYANKYHTGGVYDYGILAENSPKGTIDCNSVTGNAFQGDPGAAPQTFAFSLNLSTDNIVSCNHSDSTDVGFNFAGACQNTDFKGNQIDRHWSGLRLASAIFGQQVDAGNLWSTTHVYPKFGAFLDGSPIFPNRIVTLGALPFKPTNNGGVGLLAWFQPTINTPFSCSTFYCAAPFRIGNDSNIIGADEMQAIQGDTVVTEFNPQVSDDTKKRLFDKLENNPALQNTNSTVAQYYLDAQTNDIGTSNAVNNKTGEIETIKESNALLLNPLTNAQSTLLLEFKTNDSIINTTNDSLLKIILLVQNKNLAKGIDSLQNQIEVIAKGENIIESQKYDEARILNNNMMAQEVFDYNASVINDIYLSNIAKNNYQLSTKHISDLASIASMCPLIGGPSVYLARPIVELFDENIIYNDQAVCLSQGVNMKFVNGSALEQVEVKSNVEVYPIPSKDVVNFNFGNLQFDILVIFDSFGKQIQELKLSAKQQYILNTNLYANGIYRYKLINDNDEYLGKIVILK